MDCDYLIVGGGIAGVSLAYFLSQRVPGHIAVIEKKGIGAGATGHSAGMLVVSPEQASIAEFYKRFGTQRTSIYWHAQRAILSELKQIIRDEHLDCDFQEKPYVILEQATNTITDRNHWINHKIHYQTRLLVGKELDESTKTDYFAAAELLRDQISVNPWRLVRAMAKSAEHRGVTLFEHTPYTTYRGHIVTTPQARIRAKHIIFALDTHLPVPGVQRLKTTIAVTRRLSPGTIRRLGIVSPTMFQDYGQRSFHYGKITADHRLLVGYGDVAIDPQDPHGFRLHLPHLRHMRRFLRDFFPGLELPLAYAWSAPYGLSQSYLPLLRQNKNTTFLGGAGTQVLSMLSAKYIANRFSRRQQLLDKIFNAPRPA